MIPSIASDRIRLWRNEPCRFAKDVFNFEPDVWQGEAFDALAKPDKTGISRVAMKACAGPGKTAALAIAGWWFLLTMAQEGQHPKGMALSVSGDNLDDNLWPELAKWQNRSPLLSAAFKWQAESIFAVQHPGTWFLSARRFPKTANAEEQGKVLSGMHSEFVFVLIDETGSIAPSVGRAAEQAMGNCKRGLIAQSGNPISLDGLLYESTVTNRRDWHVIEITADPDDPRRTPRVSVDWARGQIEKYGRDNPWVMSYILGKFPPSSINTLMGSEDVLAAMRRNLASHQYSFAPKVVGPHHHLAPSGPGHLDARHHAQCAHGGDRRAHRAARQPAGGS
jgi:phage terminase large subunit